MCRVNPHRHFATRPSKRVANGSFRDVLVVVTGAQYNERHSDEDGVSTLCIVVLLMLGAGMLGTGLYFWFSSYTDTRAELLSDFKKVSCLLSFLTLPPCPPPHAFCLSPPPMESRGRQDGGVEMALPSWLGHREFWDNSRRASVLGAGRRWKCGRRHCQPFAAPPFWSASIAASRSQ